MKIMQKLAITLGAVFLSIMAHAEPSEMTEKFEINCEFKAQAAETVMSLRQMGVPLGKAIDMSNSGSMHRELVYRAYQQPIETTTLGRSSATSTFSNTVMIECLREQEG